MLMATYQPIVSLRHIQDLDEGLKRDIDDALSQQPQELEQVWCFPASTWKEAFLHSLFTSPNCSQALILLDTDNYRRIDKIKHFAAFMEAARKGKHVLGEDAIDAAEDPDCPDDCSELLIAPEELDKARAVYAFYPPLNEKTGQGLFLARMGTELRPVSFAGIPPQIMRKILAIRDKIDPTLFVPALNDIEPALMEKFIWDSARLQFMFTWLPLMYEMISGHAMIPMDLEIPVMDCFNRMAAWAVNGCDQETYMKILADARLPLDLPDGFDIRAETGRLPGRNDPCFCGSGKKFKKCHARIYTKGYEGASPFRNRRGSTPFETPGTYASASENEKRGKE